MEDRRHQRRWDRQQAEDASEIGPPKIRDEDRAKGETLLAECRDDLLAFNVKCFPNSTGIKPFGRVQEQSIEHDQAVITGGGRVVRAEPRGYGKTTRTCNAALWAVLTGRRSLVPVFSQNQDKSKTQVLGRWKAELLSNDLLFWMFPELVWCFRALENKSQRCASQTFNGELTHIRWTMDRIVMPSIQGIAGSGAGLIALPLKTCRGATLTKPDGTVVRPELLIFDDVQNDEEADNPRRVKKLEDLIDHTALMLGGHSITLAAIMNCTVRSEDDLSETYLRKPGWRRVRFKMLESPAEKERELWLDQYAAIRGSFDHESADDENRAKLEALEFYTTNREAMDAGAIASWDWAYAWNDEIPTEISAIQHAYNILIDLGPSVFASECQNEPIKQHIGFDMLTRDQIFAKQHSHNRGIVPEACAVVTMFVDVHPEILDYELWAWSPDFTGYKIADGNFPDQRKWSFTHNDPPIPLSRLLPGMEDRARIYGGLTMLFDEMLGREWMRSDGVPMRVNRCVVDANGREAEAIKLACRQSKHAAILTPSFGRGVLAKHKPISQWEQSRGTPYGPEWVPTKANANERPGVMFDANYWKTKFHQQMALPAGSAGALYLFRGSEDEHRIAVNHYTAEVPQEVEANGRKVFEWALRPNMENHRLDCAIGNMVAASMCGVTLVRGSWEVKRKRRRVKVR